MITEFAAGASDLSKSLQSLSLWFREERGPFSWCSLK